MMIKTYWKPFGLSCLLLAAGSCKEEDAVPNNTDGNVPVADTTVVAEPPTETLLLNFYAEQWYDSDSDELNEHYILISDAQGKPLVLEAVTLDQQQAIIFPGDYPEDKIQVTLLHRGPYTDDKGVETTDVLATSFLDVERGADWRMNSYYYDYSAKPTPVGYASVILRSNTDISDSWLTISGHGDLGDLTQKGGVQANDTIQVAIYENFTPLLVILSISQDKYVARIDSVEAGKDYVLDVDRMQVPMRKTFSPPSVAYDKVSAGVSGAYAQPNRFEEDELLWFGYGYLPNDEGHAYLDYPLGFPAYRTSYRLKKGNAFYEVIVNGAVPEQFPLTSFSAEFDHTSPEEVQMIVDGAADTFTATWWKESASDFIGWSVIGPGKSRTLRLPTLPDSLAIDTEAMEFIYVYFDEYDYIESYSQFIEKFHETYHRMYRECVRYEWAAHDFEQAENGRSSGKKRRPLGRRISGER